MRVRTGVRAISGSTNIRDFWKHQLQETINFGGRHTYREHNFGRRIWESSFWVFLFGKILHGEAILGQSPGSDYRCDELSWNES